MPNDLSPYAGRLVPARPDLAASHLEGMVVAARFAPGVTRSVRAGLLDLTLTADRLAERATQLIYGESFVVYEERADGLAWGQAPLDGYVGYVAAAGLGPARHDGRPITALASHVYPKPDFKSRPTEVLPFLARVAVAGTTMGFARLRSGGHVPLAHLAPLAGDFVAQAERFLGMPYLWGGRSAQGLDCSALVQLALLATGVPAPRDSDMQATQLGASLDARAKSRRGDLIFWKGHVGLLADPRTLIHASAHHMAVVKEPLAAAVERTAAGGEGPITGRRRIAGS